MHFQSSTTPLRIHCHCDFQLIHRNSHNLKASRRLESSKVRRAETSDGVPSSASTESVGVASRVRTAGDIVESTGVGVQEGVEEAEGALASRDELVVKERDDGGEDGAGAAGSINALKLTVDDDLKVGADGSNVGVCTARGVELAAVGGANGGEVALDSGRLVGGSTEVVGESTRREGRGSLAGSARELGSTDGGHAVMDLENTAHKEI